MARCEECGKKTQFGRSIQHQRGGGWYRRAPKTNRVFKPNVRRQKVLKNGEIVRMHICTRCIRTLDKRAVQ
jgi:large subunit ribosomal protein L28